MPLKLPAMEEVAKNIAPRVANSSRLYQSERYNGAALTNASDAPTRTRRPTTVEYDLVTEILPKVSVKGKYQEACGFRSQSSKCSP